jgi:fumarate hydratase subunit beta
MLKAKQISLPLTLDIIRSLHAGESVELSGIVYSARDAAHGRILESMKKGKSPVFPLPGSTIYYMGPSPARPGSVIGAAGPTTSGRMDAFTPFFLENGLKGMIGKGERSGEVVKAIKKHKAVYFLATGGAGAVLAGRIKYKKLIAYEDLGAEAVLELHLEHFPVLVGIDCHGNDLFSQRGKL